MDEKEKWVDRVQKRAQDANAQEALSLTQGQLFDIGDGLVRLIGCGCAERLMRRVEKKAPLDPRLWQGLETARRFARGQVTEEELAAAKEAAKAASGLDFDADDYAEQLDATRSERSEAAWCIIGVCGADAMGAATGPCAWDQYWEREEEDA